MRDILAELIAKGVRADITLRIVEALQAQERLLARCAHELQRRKRASTGQHVLRKNTSKINGEETCQHVLDTEIYTSPSLLTSLVATSTEESTSLEKSRPEKNPNNWPKDYREQFWARYPRKKGKDAAFRKLEIVCRKGKIAWTPFLAAVAHVGKDTDDPKFIPYPATWLHQGQYLDDLPVNGMSDSEPIFKKPPPGHETLEEHFARMEREAQNAKGTTKIRSDS